MDNAEVIAKYEALLERAQKIVQPYETGFHAHIYGERGVYLRLSIDGDQATLYWPEAESDYDSCMLGGDKVTFPAAMLSLPDEELAAWIKECSIQYERKCAAQQESRVAQREANERASYEALKRKYG